MLRNALIDGAVTGAVLCTGVVGVCGITGHGLQRCSEWLFAAGIVLVLMSAVWTVGGYFSPPGVLGVIRGDAEVYPSAPEDSLWLDRFIHPRNVWLTAGLIGVAASFAMLLL